MSFGHRRGEDIEGTRLEVPKRARTSSGQTVPSGAGAPWHSLLAARMPMAMGVKLETKTS